ncbi:prenyltransferase/squalene oxidase repeat-containing protein [Hydrogenobaculum acidophilum]
MEKAIEKSLEYVESKLCSDGGYSFYKHPYLEESNMYDTYYAIRTLLMFGKSISNKTIEYIVNSFLGADTLEQHYFSIRCLELLKEEPKKYRNDIDLEFTISFNVKSLEDINLELLRILRFKRISMYYNIRYLEEGIKEFINLLDKSDIKTLSLIYAITGNLEREIESYCDKYFGIVPTPNLRYTNISTLYAGYWLLKALDKELRYLLKAKEFILMTQDRYGAFSETLEALPDLRSNYCGIFILSL